MKARRGTNLELDGPVPPALVQRLIVKVTDRDTTYQQELDDDGNPVFDDNGDPVMLVVSDRTESEIKCYTTTPSGGLVVPLHAFSDSELEDHGYTVTGGYPDVPLVNELRAANSTIEMRPNGQDKAFEALTEKGHGFVVLGTGKGKSVLFLKAVAHWGKPALLFLHNGTLMDQWLREIDKFLGIPARRVGMCRGNYSTWRWRDKAITIAMMPSFYQQHMARKIDPAFYEAFGVVGWDEAHHCAAKTFSVSLPLFNAHRVALTATPDRDGREEIMYLHVGKPVYEDVTADLSANCYFTSVPLTNPKEFNPKDLRSYTKMASWVLGNDGSEPDEAYLEMLLKCLGHLRKRGRKTLVIVPRRKLGEVLRDAIHEISVIDQSVPFELRTHLINKHDIVAVTPAIGSEGLDRVDLDALVISYPLGRAAIDQMRQTAGRILRAMRDRSKPQPEMHIFYPENRYGHALAKGNEKLCLDLGYTIEKKVLKSKTQPAPQRANSRRQVAKIVAPK